MKISINRPFNRTIVGIAVWPYGTKSYFWRPVKIGNVTIVFSIGALGA